MSQQAFFSTAGSSTIGQPQLLETGLNSAATSIQFQAAPSPSVLYQSTGTPTFYTTTGSHFNGSSVFLPPSTGEDRKEYVAVLNTNTQLTTTSGLLTTGGQTSLSTVSSQPQSSETVAQLTPITLSHVQLTPVQMNSDMSSDEHQIIYEQYFVDVEDPSTSSVIDEDVDLDVTGETPLESDDKYDASSLKDNNEESCSTQTVTSDNSLQAKRLKQAEAARRRYQELSPEERKEVNARRMQAQKRKRQRDKEVEELENLLRKTKDIEDDVNINQELREKRIRARRAEAARLRYQRMSSEERRIYNQRRRLRQLGLQGAKKSAIDDEAVRQRILQQNAKKAEAARLRYHRMTDEEKRIYNQRRTEAFRRRRIEEEILLSTPAGRISAEALNKAQQIMMRNAKRAEAARLRYRRMTPEQRKAYNLRRSLAKKEREQSIQTSTAVLPLTPINGQHDGVVMGEDGMSLPDHSALSSSNLSEEALSALEKDVMKRTRQANMVLMKQKRLSSTPEQLVMVATAPDGTQTVIPATTTEDGKRVFHIPATVEADVADVKQKSSLRHSLQVDTLQPVVGIAQQVTPDAINTEQQHPVGTQLVAVSTQPQIVIPQVSDFHALQESPVEVDEANVETSDQPSHIIVTVQEPQQQQIIVTDLNQPTGLVLSSVSNHIRSRGRPPIYAAAAAALQQQRHDQQGGFIMLPCGQVTVARTEAGVSAEGGRRRSSSSSRRVVVSTANGQDILAVATAASVGPNISELTPQQKLELQRAKRAERARMRYHNMSEEERRRFNARRANALRKARLRDEQLCQLADSAEMAGGRLDEATMQQVEEAQRRRARRAEAARLKYHRMSSEERRQYNAMRDAQRRQRKREQEAAAMLRCEQDMERAGGIQEQVDDERDPQEHSLIYGSYVHYEEPIEHGWSE
uniref:Uncharacterized protein n=1 Tax=Parascaris univalens TaxID=6257 RepID=A0A915AT50_PARUN